MKLTVWDTTVFLESETATKKCVTVVAMATRRFKMAANLRLNWFNSKKSRLHQFLLY